MTNVFHIAFPNHYKFLLYHNFVCLAIHSMRVSYKIIIQNNIRIDADTQTVIDKWQRMTTYLEALIEGLP